MINNLITKYEKIIEILKQFDTKNNFLYQISCSRVTNIEIIVLGITAESLSIDSEGQKNELKGSFLNCVTNL